MKANKFFNESDTKREKLEEDQEIHRLTDLPKTKRFQRTNSENVVMTGPERKPNILWKLEQKKNKEEKTTLPQRK